MRANKFYYKCCVCRTRNIFNHKVEWYKIKRKCKACGHQRFYVDKERQNRSDYCDCGSTHYRHRYKSNLCSHHPEFEKYERIRRYGEEAVEVVIDIAWRSAPMESPPVDPPF